jgi:hypothetical protein
MSFAVDQGEIDLPTGRIRIEPGGTAAFRYGADWRGDITASLTVDLNATTRVTADGGFGPQRYVIQMHITGDLLSEEDLSIDASSDPPDLTRSQILSILGQQQLVENIASNVGVGDFNSQVKSLLSAVVAPALLGKVTRGIERAFGLEYVSFDFSDGGFGGITVAKALGSGFTLEYRRVNERFALLGESLEEVRLSYRPPTGNEILGRLRFTVSADRQGAYRISLGYTKRF